MTGGRQPRGLRRFLGALFVVYVAKQVAIALVSPPFTGHDEVAHFGGVRIVATEHRIPTLWSDRLPPDLFEYQPYTIEWRDRDHSPLYTAVHPPLYYVLMAPVYRAASRLTPEGIQYVLRCAAIPFGLATVVLASMLTSALFPGDAFLGVTVPTLVAFQPQVSYEAAMINNDALATALYSLILYLLVLTVRDGPSVRRAVLLGVAAGVALLSKGTTVMALGLIPAAIVAGNTRLSTGRIAALVAIAWLVAVALVGPWWWFMTRTYGDPMAFSALARTQPDLTRTDATFLQLLFSGRFVVDRWNETWGEFGWRLIHLRPVLPVALFVAAAACVAGVVLAGNTSGLQPSWRRRGLALLAAACVLSYLGAVQFGVRFVLTQARYFFPVVNAAAVLMMVGLRAWLPRRAQTVAQAIVVFAAIAVDVAIYTNYVVPYWYFR